MIEMVREAAAGVTAKYGRDYYLERANSGGNTHEMWHAMAEQNLLGLGVPEEYGGSGEGITGSVALMEVLSEAGTPPVIYVATSFSRNALLVGGTDEQKSRWVPATVNGDLQFCFGLTEPDAGTNTFRNTTRATRVDGGYSLSGQKIFISHADEAEKMMVVAKVKLDNGKDDMALFMVDLPAEGMTLQKLNIEMYAPDRRFIVFLDDVFVPEENRIGRDGDGKRLLFAALNPERFLISAQAIGLGNRALQQGTEYAKTRSPFREPIGSYQAIQHPLAKAKINLDASRVMMYDGCADFDGGNHDIAAKANVAKFLSTTAANDAIDAAIQAHGGYAFDLDTDLMTLFPVIRLMRVAPVNNEMTLNYVAERMLGLPRSY
jgi:alkylation response protein AidB-like acyl-CoA dehydrogenase